MIIYTIGFSGKSAEQFFTLLRESGTRRILDIRLNPAGQLSGFAKARDLPYFLKALCGVDYVYLPDFAPSAALLSGYRQATIDWPSYERIYRHEMETRAAEQRVSPDLLDGGCLLCSEALPGQCHRRLAAEYLSEFTPGLAVVHL